MSKSPSKTSADAVQTHNSSTHHADEIDRRAKELREAAIRLSRTDRQRVNQAIEALEAALGEAAPNREEAWAAKVTPVLRDLEAAMSTQRGHSNSEEGLLADIAANEPRFERRIKRLHEEYHDLARQITTLCGQFENRAADDIADFADVRHRVRWLVSALRHHQFRETDLIYEAIATDIGVGD